MKTKTRSAVKSISKKSTSKAKPSKSPASSGGKTRAAANKNLKSVGKGSKATAKSKASSKAVLAEKNSRTAARKSAGASKPASAKPASAKPASAMARTVSPKKDALPKKSVASKKQEKIAATKTLSSARQKTTGRSVQGEVKTKSGTMLKAVTGLKAAAEGSKPESKAVKKISVTEKLSTSHLVKRQSKPKATKAKRSLKLVKKGPINVPATKISRSDSYASDSKVIMGNFSFGEDDSRPVVAHRKPVLEQEVDNKGVSVLFESGDKIVYPGHGVGEIEGIRSTVLDGQEHHIYNITILESGMKVMVPVSQAASVGLRKIIDKQAIDEVFSILRDRDFKIDTQTWNRRFREYSQKIKTGSVFEIAIVLRDLSVLSVDKELSFGEKKMLDMAESLLVSEIALARSRPHEKVAGELRALFTT